MKSGEIRSRDHGICMLCHTCGCCAERDRVIERIASECLDLRRRLARALRNQNMFESHYCWSLKLKEERAELRARRGR